MASKIINVDAEIMNGTPVFWGTRVPVKNLFDYLESGETLEQFLDDFPSVKKKQAIGALEIAQRLLTKSSEILNESIVR